MTTRLPIRKSNKKNFGFTLIEMLVVVLIMGILLAVAIPLYLSSVRTAAENTCRANMKSVATALAANRVKAGAYEADITKLLDLPTGINTSQTGITLTTTAAGEVVGTETKDVMLTSAADDAITLSLTTGKFDK